MFTAKAWDRASAAVRVDKLNRVGAVLFRDDAKGDGCHTDTETIEASGSHFTRRDPAGFKASYDGENATVLTAASAHHGDRQYLDGRGHAHTVRIPFAFAPPDTQRKRYQKRGFLRHSSAVAMVGFFYA